MKDIILAGIQGSGKGTQAKKILQKYQKKISYFEMGGILRALMGSNNVIGNYLTEIVNNGILVKDEIVVGLFKVYLETLEDQTILIDGAFRRTGQTKGILSALLEKKRDPLVIQLEIPEEEVLKRLQTRKMCKDCDGIFSTLKIGETDICPDCGGQLYVRSDDSDPKAIQTRINAYKEETIPALDYVASLGLLVKIDGMQSEDAIFEQIEKRLLS